jgi:WG containing repeat
MRSLYCAATASLMLLALANGEVRAQAPDMSGAIAVCDGKFGLCRYVDRRTRQELIPARFERAMAFSEGVAAVRIDGRFGYIDARGEVVIAPRFDLAGRFYQGLAEILVGNKAAIINRNGDIVVPPIFKHAIPLTRDVIVAAEGTWTSGYYEGYETLDSPSEMQDRTVKYGLYHVGGYWSRPPDLTSLHRFESDGRGLIWATTGEFYFGPFGLLASDGRWVVEPQYEHVGWLSEDRAVVRKRVGGRTPLEGTLLTGAVDGNGEVAIPLQPQALFGWNNGWSLVKEDGKEGLVDRNGALIGGRYFDKVEPWSVGDVSAVLIEGRWVGLHRSGAIVPHPGNGRVLKSCPSGVTVRRLDGKTQIVDADGRQTTPYLFESLLSPATCDRPFPVGLDNKWGFIGLDGCLLVDPPGFDSLTNFERGYAVVKQASKWGIIDTTGRFVLAPTFDGLIERREDLFHVQMDGRKLWITATGEERPEPPITYTPSPDMLACGHGLKLAERDSLWGIVDDDGKDVIAPRYRAVACFKDGVAWAPIDDQRRWCALGPDGGRRQFPPCRTTHYPYIQSHSYPEQFAKDDPFENSVLWTRAFLEFGIGKRPVPPDMIPDGPRAGWHSITR